jgi:hypothetical protein
VDIFFFFIFYHPANVLSLMKPPSPLWTITPPYTAFPPLHTTRPLFPNDFTSLTNYASPFPFFSLKQFKMPSPLHIVVCSSSFIKYIHLFLPAQLPNERQFSWIDNIKNNHRQSSTQSPPHHRSTIDPLDQLTMSGTMTTWIVSLCLPDRIGFIRTIQHTP